MRYLGNIYTVSFSQTVSNLWNSFGMVKQHKIHEKTPRVHVGVVRIITIRSNFHSFMLLNIDRNCLIFTKACRNAMRQLYK